MKPLTNKQIRTAILFFALVAILIAVCAKIPA